jgi:hypothetical protein
MQMSTAGLAIRHTVAQVPPSKRLAGVGRRKLVTCEGTIHFRLNQ